MNPHLKHIKGVLFQIFKDDKLQRQGEQRGDKNDTGLEAVKQMARWKLLSRFKEAKSHSGSGEIGEMIYITESINV